MRVRTSLAVPGRVADAEALWYDPARWAAWIDGFGHLVALDGPWPATGGRRVWDAPPGGRGRVVERVLAYEPRVGQTLAVEDEKLTGTQAVAFAPEGAGARVTLSLEWSSKRGARPLRPLADLTLVRRSLLLSMGATLRRFAIERRAEAEPV
jgi:hypothetical protein